MHRRFCDEYENKKDMVSVVSGKDKGKSGKVTKILTKKSKAFVEGINLVKKHTKPSQTNKGGIETRNAGSFVKSYDA